MTCLCLIELSWCVQIADVTLCDGQEKEEDITIIRYLLRPIYWAKFKSKIKSRFIHPLFSWFWLRSPFHNKHWSSFYNTLNREHVYIIIIIITAQLQNSQCDLIYNSIILLTVSLVLDDNKGNEINELEDHLGSYTDRLYFSFHDGSLFYSYK